MIEIIPSILENNFSEIRRKIFLVEPYVSWAQIDFLDGSLFGNSNFHDLNSFTNLHTGLMLEAHLMVAKAQNYIDSLYATGFNRFLVHFEGIKDIGRFLEENEQKGFELGIALDIETEVDKIWSYLELLDVVLVMGIHTGKSGQTFMPKSLDKIKKIRQKNSHIPIMVDGGIDLETAPTLIRAGATRLAVTTAIFAAPDPIDAIEKFKMVS